jgi:pyrimidine-nucleoside phosphorylase
MAVFFRGMDDSETAALTESMRCSGDVLAFPPDSRPLVDKHSTGGVGDKVSLPLAPLLACLGFRVPMISGRGLGITGGTLDKLDSIPGFKTALPTEVIVEIVQSVGCVICGQTARMVPADRKLYALRDVTGTVPSIPLIVSSILSKKLAEGLDALILDVKWGAAAFMGTLPKARALAQAMVKLGNGSGVKTRALLTNMDSPIGSAVGNWLEIRESASFLAGTAQTDDLKELVFACAAHLLVQTGKASDLTTARATAVECLASGEPLKRWEKMLQAQGADLDAYHKKLGQEIPCCHPVPSEMEGFVTRVDALKIGEVVRDLGGGRLRQDAALNYEVGLDQIVKLGTKVSQGTQLARLFAPDHKTAKEILPRVAAAFRVEQAPPELVPLITDSITAPRRVPQPI